MDKTKYNKFRNKLSQDKRDELDAFYETKLKDNKERIENGIETDKNHLEIVNYCANFFQIGSIINLDLGYVLLVVDSLYGTGRKNFDLAIFHQERKHLILVECKSSISDINKELNDIKEKIDQTLENLEELTTLLGDEIIHIDFVICTDGNLALELVESILDKGYPICTWACSPNRKEIKLFKSRREEHGESMKFGRVHKDEDLNLMLYKAVKSKLGSNKILPFLPSSNMCNVLTEVNFKLKQLHEGGTIEDAENISFKDVYFIVERILKLRVLDNIELDKLVEKIIKKGIKKEIYQDKTKELTDIKRKLIKFILASNTPKRIVSRTVKKYVDLNAAERAREDTYNEFVDEPLPQKLDNFM